MIIGVPKEIKNNENRVGMVPGGVRALVSDGHTVYVQKNAGLGIGITDEEFVKAGAQILDTASEVFENNRDSCLPYRTYNQRRHPCRA